MNSVAVIAAIALGCGLWSLVTVFWPAHSRTTWVSHLGPYLLDVSERARELNRPVIEDPLVIGGFVVGQGLKSWANRFD